MNKPEQFWSGMLCMFIVPLTLWMVFLTVQVHDLNARQGAAVSQWRSDAKLIDGCIRGGRTVLFDGVPQPIANGIPEISKWHTLSCVDPLPNVTHEEPPRAAVEWEPDSTTTLLQACPDGDIVSFYDKEFHCMRPKKPQG